jgi:hypothetical protein
MLRDKTEYFVLFDGNNPSPVIYNSYMQAVCKALEDIEKVDPTFSIFVEK